LWRLEIFSIWKAGWDDVERFAGIYAKAVADDGLRYVGTLIRR
jgi:hypothetical protein